MLYQSEAAECGLACIAMVANHHGHQLDLTTLRNRYSVSLKGANLQQLMQLANQLGLTAFWTKVQGLIPSLSKLFILSLLLQVFVLAAPYYTQLVVDEVLVSQDKPLLMVLALGFGLIMLLQVITQTLRGWVVLHLGSVMSVQMAANLMRHLLHLPLSYFEKRHMGDVVSRFGSLNSVRELLTNSLVEGVIDGIMAITVLVMMYLYSP